MVCYVPDNKEIALLLIEKRANINAENNDKNTPLISAAENGNFKRIAFGF